MLQNQTRGCSSWSLLPVCLPHNATGDNYPLARGAFRKYSGNSETNVNVVPKRLLVSSGNDAC
jgi:hypothetical protein